MMLKLVANVILDGSVTLYSVTKFIRRLTWVRVSSHTVQYYLKDNFF